MDEEGGHRWRQAALMKTGPAWASSSRRGTLDPDYKAWVGCQVCATGQ